MFYLILAILCSSSIALIFKYTEGNNMNRFAVTTSNYFTAFIVCLAMLLINKVQLLGLSGNFNKEFVQVVIHSGGSFSKYSSLIWAIIIGIFAGAFFFLSFIYYQKSVKKNGASLSGTFGKLGILIPMCMSIILWDEYPTPLQWAGIILSILSIIIVNVSFNKKSLSSVNFTLILLFFFGGMAEFSNKIFQKYSLIEYKDVFLFFVFFISFLISLYSTLKSKSRVSAKDLIIGFLVGIPNLFSSFFLILALNTVKTSVAFPIYSASSIVLISLGSFIIFKEKLQKKDMTAIIITIVALIIINI
jgi:multidrug transporter EmrE-like cation transporter